MDNHNARIKELCGVRKGLDENIGEGILQWRGIDRIAKIVYIGECAGSHSFG